jgi:hypothetical protein
MFIHGCQNDVSHRKIDTLRAALSSIPVRSLHDLFKGMLLMTDLLLRFRRDGGKYDGGAIVGGGILHVWR